MSSSVVSSAAALLVMGTVLSSVGSFSEAGHLKGFFPSDQNYLVPVSFQVSLAIPNHYALG
jgi:hypothetical protein